MIRASTKRKTLINRGFSRDSNILLDSEKIINHEVQNKNDSYFIFYKYNSQLCFPNEVCYSQDIQQDLGNYY